MNIVEASKQTLLELKSVLSQLEDNVYSQPLAIFSNSSIGMHTRHILEFYKCIIDQSEVINYDKRLRDLTLQSNVDYCKRTIDEIVQYLDMIQDHHLSKELIITSDEENSTNVKSSLGRELQYNLEHTIHHSALLKVGFISLDKGYNIPATFGVAPSTLSYQRR
jgi:uncharacterized damage-inducible protein DinB